MTFHLPGTDEYCGKCGTRYNILLGHYGLQNLEQINCDKCLDIEIETPLHRNYNVKCSNCECNYFMHTQSGCLNHPSCKSSKNIVLMKQNKQQVEISHNINNPETKITTGPQIISQNLEPNSAEIWIGNKGDILFKVRSFKSDLSLAVEETVEQFNRLAKATGKSIIDLNTIIIPSSNLENIKKQQENNEEWDKISDSRKSKNKNPKAFGNRLRKYRLLNGMKLSKLAEELNIEKEVMLKIEMCEDTLPSEENILHISEILQLDDTKYTYLINSHKKDKYKD